MKERLSFKDGIQIGWDATSLDTAQACLRKYYYRMILNVVPQDTSVHLLFGGLYAKALETFYHYRAEGMSLDSALLRVVEQALWDSWDHVYDEAGNVIQGGAPIAFNDPKKTRISLIQSIIWYVDEFGHESKDGIQTHHLQNGTPAVELSFALPLSEDLYYCGHLDRVVSYGGQLYWMDQKTTGSALSSYYFSNFRPNNQFTGYSWAGKIVLQSPVAGGIIDAAQIAVGFTRFERAFISHTEAQINEWLDGTFYTIELAQQATREQHFPMNLTACGNYGGCPYRQLCAISPSLREAYLKSNFHTIEPWDPLRPR